MSFPSLTSLPPSMMMMIVICHLYHWEIFQLGRIPYHPSPYPITLHVPLLTPFSPQPVPFSNPPVLQTLAGWPVDIGHPLVNLPYSHLHDPQVTLLGLYQVLRPLPTTPRHPVPSTILLLLFTTTDFLIWTGSLYYQSRPINSRISPLPPDIMQLVHTLCIIYNKGGEHRMTVCQMLALTDIVKYLRHLRPAYNRCQPSLSPVGLSP